MMKKREWFYPLKLDYVTRGYIWGGTRLAEEWGKKPASGSDVIAESWELTVRTDAMSRIENGECKGMTLKEYFAAVGYDSVCSLMTEKSDFPLLIKLIDAADDLSVQVHPDDGYARAHGAPCGKNEMWYIIDAKPGAKIAYGLSHGLSASDFGSYVESGNYAEALNYISVKPGESYFIPAGMIHAIGRGILIAEIQQNCDITYRVYDYERRQRDGTFRQLHIKDALNVVKSYDRSDADRLAFEMSGGIKRYPGRLAECRYFTTDIIDTSKNGPCEMYADEKSFHSLICIEGSGSIGFENNDFAFSKGDSYFIPAMCGRYTLNGDMKIIKTTL